MTRARDSAPTDSAPASVVPQRIQATLLWSGAALCVAGLAWHRMWEQLPWGRFLELVVLALASLALAWPLRRFAHLHWATALACIWIAALALFADPLPLLSVALVAPAATVIGGWIAGKDAPPALACACGLALLAGVLGWLLPLPVHSRWSYLALCLLVIGIGYRGLLARLGATRGAWTKAVSAHPRAAVWGVLALGLASTGCWLPTMQYDDLAYHLGLPWQLMTTGRYALDPTHQVWALAPWAADVQQALPQVIAGAEARGPLNALWIGITAAGLWRLGEQLGLEAAARWGAIALYASLPLTAGLAAGMQTETATTALLVWLAWLVLRNEPDGSGSRGLWTGAVLVGGLVGLKLMGAVYASVLVACAAWLHRPWSGLGRLLVACAIVLAVAASSYVYAAVVAGNPFLPLLNGSFQSPYFPPSNYEDARWHAGFSLALPWQVTFATRAYSETLPGSAGFALIALAGAWALSFTHRRARVLTAAGTLLLVIVFVPLQYLRYAFPALVLLLPALVAASTTAAPRQPTWLLASVAVLGFAFHANGNWMQRTGALKQTVVAWGRDAPVWLEYAPERQLAMQLREAGVAPVLVLDQDAPAYAELGTAGRTTAWYAPPLWRDAAQADDDPSGARWATVIERSEASDILLRRSHLTPAQAAAMQRVGATRHAVSGDAEWWKLNAESTP